MPRVFIPPSLRSLIPNVPFVDVEARSVRGLIEQLETLSPGVRDRLCNNDVLKPGLAISIDGQVATLGMYQKLQPQSEVHIILAIGGG